MSVADGKSTDRRRGRAVALGLAAAMGVSALAGGTAFGADRPDAPDRGAATGSDGTDRVPARNAAADVSRTVFVRFDKPSALDAFNAAGDAVRGKDAAVAARTAIDAEAERILDEAADVDPGATEVYRTTNAVAGVVLQVDDAAVAAIAADPGVVSVLPVINKTIENIGAVELTQTLAEWTNAGLLGEGVSVGIIDTGIDYTHTGFGGPGTQAAFDAAAAPAANGPAIPWTPTAKVVGGTDFAGDAYTGSNLPVPDNNPLDCQGHGSHVAGSAAGFGVNADGSTFAGAYEDLTLNELQAMKIGPGTAPLADLYALRVFGCDGSTGLVLQALDWALDPNDDGVFDDRLDVINMSLGSSYGISDDPETLFVDVLAENGVVTVSSAGNEGDLTHIAGSPGNAVRGITVANTVAGRVSLDQLIVNAPAEVAGVYGGQFSVAYSYPGLERGPLPVVELASVQPGNPEGCLAYDPTAAAAVAGKAVWVEWPIDFACGSVARANAAGAAGAAAIIFSSEEEIFSAGLTGNNTVPLFQFTASATATVRPALEAGTLTVSFDGDLAGVSSPVPTMADTINSSTSRGGHGIVKPDLSAPGTLIGSVGVGTGSGIAVMSGTSMAAPHAAGIAALLREAQPTWSVEQLKAGLMNTADHDLFTGPSGTGDIYGPNRVGAGRVDAAAAVDNTLLAYADAGTGRVSASFGNVAVPIDGGEVVLTKDITVQNTGTEAVTAGVDYLPAVVQPGVDFSLSVSSVTVPAGATATVTVTAAIDPTALRRTLDPTMDRLTDAGWGAIPRAYIADASGRVLITPEGATSGLRVPVHVAAEPVSTTTASLTAVDGHAALTQLGTGLDQGDWGVDNYTGQLAVYELLAASARMPDCEAGQTADCIPIDSARGYDIRHVGISSDFHEADSLADTYVSFAVSTWGERPTSGTVGWITTYIQAGDNLFAAQTAPVADTDLYFVDLYRMVGGNFTWVGDSWLGEFTHDSGVKIFDTSLLTFGFPAGVFFPGGLPADPADAVISVDVEGASYYAAPDAENLVVDYVQAGDYSIGDPGIHAEVSFGDDLSDFTTDVFRAAGSDASHVMVTHSQGSDRARADILPYRDGSQVDFAEAIDWFIAEGLTTDDAAGFRPTAPVTRQAMAAFLHRYAEGSAAPAECTTAPFTDVPVSHPFCAEITWLVEQGITTGYGDGTFRPAAPVSRQAMGVFLERFAGAPMTESQECEASSGFSDVPNDSPFCQSIRWVTAETGVSGGYGDGTFRPTAPISRQAMASFLMSFSELVVPRVA